MEHKLRIIMMKRMEKDPEHLDIIYPDLLAGYERLSTNWEVRSFQNSTGQLLG
jgi:hypothetical protein